MFQITSPPSYSSLLRQSQYKQKGKIYENYRFENFQLNLITPFHFSNTTPKTLQQQAKISLNM